MLGKQKTIFAFSLDILSAKMQVSSNWQTNLGRLTDFVMR
jgi:hypothetical protein